ncbi:MAG: YlbF family regulator [Bacillota bacterium]
MNVYDLAHSLAKAIRNSQEFREYKTAAEKVASNPQHKRMLHDFREKQYELQRAHLTGQQISENKKQELLKLQGILAANPVMNTFLATEYRFGQMMADIQKIVAADLDFLPKK